MLVDLVHLQAGLQEGMPCIPILNTSLNTRVYKLVYKL